jgi:hypothetical protein
MGAVSPEYPQDRIHQNRGIECKKKRFHKAGVIPVVVLHHGDIASNHITDIGPLAHYAADLRGNVLALEAVFIPNRFGRLYKLTG